MQSIHDVRLFNFAIIDVIGTIVLGFLTNKYLGIPLLVAILCMFVLGIIAHVIFKQNTTLNYYLGLSDKPIYTFSGHSHDI